MIDDLTAEEIRDLLKLEPHATCGFVRVTFISCATMAPSALWWDPNLREGQCVQLFIPGNAFHTARVIGHRRWFLGASTEWPGVEPADVEIGDVEALAAKYPDVAADLHAFSG